MPPPKLLPSMQTAPKSPGAFKPDPNAVDRPDLLSVPVDFIKGLIGMDANSTGRVQNGKPSLLSSPNAAGQTLSSGLPIAGGSKLLYSRLERAAKNLPEFAHPNKILRLLKPHVSGEEMTLRGMMDFLKSQGERKVAKSAVLEHLAGNPLPRVDKTTLTPLGKRNVSAETVNRSVYDGFGLQTPLKAQASDYRENLYHLEQPGEPYNAPHFDGLQLGPYREESNHNLLMHSRTTERDLPEQGKTLLGEEDQSDWHQTGRKEGYKDANYDPTLLDELKAKQREYLHENDELERWGRSQELSEDDLRRIDELDQLMTANSRRMGELSGVFAVPDAPYKQEWPNMLWKDQLGQAVTDPEIKGYAWAQGSEQNRRAGNLPGQQVEGFGDFETAADAAAAQKPMQDFYDVRKRNAIDKFVKGHGGRVEEITVPGVPKPKPPKDYAVTPRGEIQELPSPDEWGEMGDEGDVVASVWPQFRGLNEDLPRGFQVIDALERQQDAKGLTIPTEVKLWYVSLPDHVKESIKRGGIPFLMALWATHQAGQDNNMSVPNPPNGVNQ